MSILCKNSSAKLSTRLLCPINFYSNIVFYVCMLRLITYCMVFRCNCCCFYYKQDYYYFFIKYAEIIKIYFCFL